MGLGAKGKPRIPDVNLPESTVGDGLIELCKEFPYAFVYRIFVQKHGRSGWVEEVQLSAYDGSINDPRDLVCTVREVQDPYRPLPRMGTMLRMQMKMWNELEYMRSMQKREVAPA